MEIKDRVEILNKQIDSLDKEANIIYKKLFVLLASEAGVGSLLFKFENSIFFIFFILLIIFTVIIVLNYYRLGVLRNKVKDINSYIERIINE